MSDIKNTFSSRLLLFVSFDQSKPKRSYFRHTHAFVREREREKKTHTMGATASTPETVNVEEIIATTGRRKGSSIRLADAEKEISMPSNLMTFVSRFRSVEETDFCIVDTVLRARS
jgi:hypothetical protein